MEDMRIWQRCHVIMNKSYETVPTDKLRFNIRGAYRTKPYSKIVEGKTSFSSHTDMHMKNAGCIQLKINRVKQKTERGKRHPPTDCMYASEPED